MASPVSVVIVGSGPSGLYAAEALTRSTLDVIIDVLERLPTPFGLVRGGVAPDHQKTKAITAAFERICSHPALSLFANVEVGRDISLEELSSIYDVVILACGAGASATLDVPGETLPGVIGAANLVGWYNGHPDFRNEDVDLACKAAVVVGHGNVALDVGRILASGEARLAGTDIARHAQHELQRSKLTDIWLVGRRGPAQAKFTTAELRELGTLQDWDIVVSAPDLALNEASALEAKGSDVVRRNLEVLAGFSERPRVHGRRIHIAFNLAPLMFLGTSRLEAVSLGRYTLQGEAGVQSAIRTTSDPIIRPCGLAVLANGYRGVRIPGVPFDEKRGTFPNRDGRLVCDGEIVPRIYVAGWIKRGPGGVIGTNRADSASTVDKVLEDLPSLSRRSQGARGRLAQLLDKRGVSAISYAGWERINASEKARGAGSNKPREKHCEWESLRAVAHASGMHASSND